MELYKGLSYIDYAEYAVRTKDLKFIYEGLINIDKNIEYLEPLDIITLLSLFYNSLKKNNENPDMFFKTFSSDNDVKNIKDYLLKFLLRSIEDKTIEKMGYKEINEPIFRYVIIK
jgi:hypothetical protein